MKSKLGYSKTRRRVPVKGKIADRAYEVDVHGEKSNPLAQAAFLGGIILAIVAVLMLFAPSMISGLKSYIESTVARFIPSLAGGSFLVVGVIAIVLGYLGREKSITHAWVECKDLKRNVKRAHVQKLAASVKDVRDLEEAKWKPTEVMIVSGTDFDSDALAFAREHKFTCYRRSSRGGFEVVQ
jgi:hypothetical protein